MTRLDRFLASPHGLIIDAINIGIAGLAAWALTWDLPPLLKAFLIIVIISIAVLTVNNLLLRRRIHRRRGTLTAISKHRIH